VPFKTEAKTAEIEEVASPRLSQTMRVLCERGAVGKGAAGLAGHATIGLIFATLHTSRQGRLRWVSSLNVASLSVSRAPAGQVKLERVQSSDDDA
jgi:hypothetical protein